MGKTTHYVDGNTGQIVRETKVGNKVTREYISQDQLDNYETGSNIFGCIGSIVGLLFFVYLCTFIFGGN